MPYQQLLIKPGVDVEASPLARGAGWAVSSLIRFRSGLAEALRGWAAVTVDSMLGVCRALHYWVDLSQQRWLAAGTNLALYVKVGMDFEDITPTTDFTPGPSTSGSTPFRLLVWSLDNFGQNMIAVPSGQGIFVWVPLITGSQSPATLISQAPTLNQGALVTMPAQIVMAYGSAPALGRQDPLLIRWCDQSDYTAWTVSTTNQAGSFRLSRGNRIVGGLQAPATTLLWTDLDLWIIQYIGFPLVFTFMMAGARAGLIAQKAAVVVGSVVYWMSDHGFYQLSGSGATLIPCSVWDQVYDNLDTLNQDKCLAGTDEHYSEVWFLFPSTNSGTGEIDSYVKLNIAENLWDYGPATAGSPNQMARTAWSDQNQPGSPVSVDLGGLVQQQDVGFTADGTAIAGMIRSGYVDISAGNDLLNVDQFIPDFLWDGDNPNINVTLYFRNYPGETPTTMGPFNISPTTEYVTLRSARSVTVGGVAVTAYPAVRAREVAVQIDTVSGWWRWGAPRLRAAPAGRLP